MYAFADGRFNGDIASDLSLGLIVDLSGFFSFLYNRQLIEFTAWFKFVN